MARKNGLEIPEDVNAAFNTPGENWTKEKIACVCAFLLSPAVRCRLELLVIHNLSRTTPDRKSEAEDLVQQFVLRKFLITELPGLVRKFDPAKGEFWNYLLRSLRNACRDASRLRKHEMPVAISGERDRHPLLDETLVDPAPSIEAQMIQREEVALRGAVVQGALRALPAGETELLWGLHVEGRSIRNLAEEHNIGLSAVKQRLRRTRLRLRKRLEDDMARLFPLNTRKERV